MNLDSIINTMISYGIVIVVLLVLSLIALVFIYMLVQWFKYRGREKYALDFVSLLIRLPRESETKIDAAEQMLGRPYVVCGVVVEGMKLGRTIGFPTANMATGDAQLPMDGVWAVHALLPDGRTLPGVANLGLRPTVHGKSRALEVHLFDHDADLYGQPLEIRFRRHLRAEIKFPSVDALRSQIQRDAQEAKKILAALPTR